MTFWIFLVLPRLILSISIYFAPESDIRVNSYDLLNFSRASVGQSERLDILLALIRHPSQKSCPFQFSLHFHVEFRASRYIMCLNRTSDRNVMTKWVCRELPLFKFEHLDILCAWIGHPIEDLWVFEFLETFVVQLRAFRYIFGQNRTSKSKAMTVWICLVLLCLILSNSIYYAPESGIQIKSYNHFNFLGASVVQVRASRYIIGLNRISDSKVVAIWICLALCYLISSILIYYAPESGIRVKSFDHLNFSRASIVQFRASQYIIGLNRTSNLKVVAVWIWLVLPCLILSISIYYAPESGIRVKSYDHLNFSRASVAQFWASQYIIRLNRTSESKVVAVGICHAFGV